MPEGPGAGSRCPDRLNGLSDVHEKLGNRLFRTVPRNSMLTTFATGAGIGLSLTMPHIS